MNAILRAAVFLVPFLLSAVRPVAAWTVPAYVDLAWPPPQPGDYLWKAGESLSGIWNSEGSCLGFAVPKNVTRMPFPVCGGRLQFDVVNANLPTKDGLFTDHYVAIQFYLRYLRGSNEGGFFRDKR